MTATSKIRIIARKGKKINESSKNRSIPISISINFFFFFLTGFRHYKYSRGVNFPLPSAASDLLILQGLWAPSEMLSFKMYSEKMIRATNFQPLVKKYLQASLKENSV